MERWIKCEVCGTDVISIRCNQRYCGECAKIVKKSQSVYTLECKICGKKITKGNKNSICLECRKAQKQAVEELVKKQGMSARRCKSLKQLDQTVLELNEYNIKHGTKLTYGYYMAMKDGLI